MIIFWECKLYLYIDDLKRPQNDHILGVLCTVISRIFIQMILNVLRMIIFWECKLYLYIDDLKRPRNDHILGVLCTVINRIFK